MQELDFFATTTKGTEELLAQELREFGAQNVELSRSGVQFKGKLEIGYRACLWSRVASRILLPLRTFAAPDPDRLYAGVRSIHWTDHLSSNDTLAVDFSTSQSQITHSHYGALKVKDAIVDQFRAVEGVRPSVDPIAPSLRINVYLFKDQATVSIDLSGDSLHKRGYRKQNAPAPLKENLGAALLKMAGWPKTPLKDFAFLDPMCGSGTLPIEAAMMMGQIAPGLNREYYGFKGWAGHVPVLWKRLLQEAQTLRDECIADPKKFPKIVGYDSDFRMVRTALSYVHEMGLHKHIHIEKRSFGECRPVAEKGILLVNPPYGERLGETEELKPLYKLMGDTFKQHFKGWESYILTANSDLAKCVGLKTSKKIVLFNGPLECRLLKYDLY